MNMVVVAQQLAASAFGRAASKKTSPIERIKKFFVNRKTYNEKIKFAARTTNSSP
jgi:hypothetical protein